jgi:hypothetical protein
MTATHLLLSGRSEGGGRAGEGKDGSELHGAGWDYRNFAFQGSETLLHSMHRSISCSFKPQLARVSFSRVRMRGRQITVALNVY